MTADTVHTVVWDLRYYWGADKSLARLRRKQAKVTEDFDVHIFYL